MITEFQDPGKCTFRWSGGSHRADLVVWTIDKKGREVKVLLECEPMSNPLYQVEKMLDGIGRSLEEYFWLFPLSWRRE